MQYKGGGKKRLKNRRKDLNNKKSMSYNESNNLNNRKLNKNNMLNIDKELNNDTRYYGDIEDNQIKINESATLCKKNAIPLEDKLSMLLLILLYTLQGIPMGLSGSVPLLMKERGVSYEGLSLFSLVSIPFSLKLMWAPLVDSCYIPRFGRRKTWLVPVQLLTGISMMIGSQYIELWLGSDNSSNNVENAIQTNVLTLFFFFLYLLMATQDIAVDGWALTMLSRENVGYASTCNSIGQSFGFFLANQGFIALSDYQWCHRHLGLDKSLVTLSGFIYFWGWIFIITTIIICFGKKEKKEDHIDEPGIIETYKQVISIFKLKSVQLLCLVLFTCKIAFAPADAVSGYKLLEYGMPKVDIATISPILLVIGLLLPALISNIANSRPLDMFMVGITLKLLTTLLGWYVIQYTTEAYANKNSISWTFFASLILVMVVHEIASNFIFIPAMSFFAKISDPSIGGTYMTLLNTMSNLGSKWPNVTALWLLPKLTQTSCKIFNENNDYNINNSIDCSNNISSCVDIGGSCSIDVDGYTIETWVCFVIGILWIIIFKDLVIKMQYYHRNEWLVNANNNSDRRKI
jgi:PAT family acetyl-CoA transporter-like MFS transporter 1